MATKKKKRYTKRQTQQFYQKVTGTLFAITILFMAGYSIREGYLTSLSEDEQIAFDDDEHLFISSISPVSQKMQELYGVRPSVSIAQAILESDWGRSELAADYHNLYGRKSSDPNQSVLMETSEFANGQWIIISDTFKVYENETASVEDHARLMVNGTDWNSALYHPVIAAPTYQEAAQALGQAGYATDPDYPKKLIDIIELYQLYKYDIPN